MAAENIKRLTVRLSIEEYETLRRMAFEQRISMNDLCKAGCQNISGQKISLNESTPVGSSGKR
jgi:hypothetical protein